MPVPFRALAALLVTLASVLASPPAALLPAFAAAAPADDGDAALDALISGTQRGERNRLRDPYRHPAATLRFFGLRPDQTVVEIWPGGSGWWTEILAPYLRDHGRYYAALPSPASSEENRSDDEAFAAKVAADPALYGRVVVTAFDGGAGEIAPAGTADLVLTFRNLHNWMKAGTAEAALAAFYRALKPGGVLGIEEHRAATDRPQDPRALSGYVREDYAIALAERAGFRLAGRAEINANPRDTKDYPAGVWTLPPTLRLKDQDRAKYLAIGESDRFTLKLVKPGP